MMPQAVETPVAPQVDEERLAWLALVLTPGLGPKRILDAAKQLKAVSQIFTLPLTSLEGLRFPAEAAQFIFDGKARTVAEEEWARVAAQGATLVTYGCAKYPERLKEIYDPPPVLWVRGAASILSRPGIAVVGTRHPSPYGSGMAEMISRSGGTAVADYQRHGAGDRLMRAQGGTGSAYAHRGRVGHRN